MRSISIFVSVAIVAVSTTALATGAPAKTVNMRCSLEMQQFKTGSGKSGFPRMIGDSNQDLEFKLTGDDHSVAGSAAVRFDDDQSGPASISLHGVRAVAEFSQGSGLTVRFGIVRFADRTAKSPSTVVAGVASTSDEYMDIKVAAEQMKANYFHPVMLAQSPLTSTALNEMLADGRLHDFDLAWINVGFCRVH